MKSLTVDIPVQTYLKKYLYAQENMPIGTPIDTTKGGHLPIVMELLFTGKTDLNFHNESLGNIDDSIPVIVSIRKMERMQVIISTERVRFLNAFLFRSFHDNLLTRVLSVRRFNYKEVDVIKDLMHELDIIDDVSFDAIKKASYRLRKSRNLPMFS